MVRDDEKVESIELGNLFFIKLIIKRLVDKFIKY